MPEVVVLAGPPCSGKSTLGRWLAGALPGVHCEVDKLVGALFGHSTRTVAERLLGYSVAAHAVGPILARGVTAILDCTYSRGEVRRELVETVAAEDRLVVIEFRVSPEVALARYAQRRGHEASDLTSGLVLERVRAYPYGCANGSVDGEGSTEDIRAAVLRIIDAGARLDRHTWAQAGV